MANGDWISDVISFRLEHLLKALMEMVDTVLGIVIADKPVHPSKAEPLMVFSPSDRLIQFRPVQSSKAELPMVFTVPGTFSDVMVLHW